MKLPRVFKTNRGKLDLGEVAIVRRRFIKYVKPHWKALVIAFLATIGVVAANLAAPWPIKLVFDLVLGDAMASSTVGRVLLGMSPSSTTPPCRAASEAEAKFSL